MCFPLVLVHSSSSASTPSVYPHVRPRGSRTSAPSRHPARSSPAEPGAEARERIGASSSMEGDVLHGLGPPVAVKSNDGHAIRPSPFVKDTTVKRFHEDI